jgi:hypothetical protein
MTTIRPSSFKLASVPIAFSQHIHHHIVAGAQGFSTPCDPQASPLRHVTCWPKISAAINIKTAKTNGAAKVITKPITISAITHINSFLKARCLGGSIRYAPSAIATSLSPE